MQNKVIMVGFNLIKTLITFQSVWILLFWVDSRIPRAWKPIPWISEIFIESTDCVGRWPRGVRIFAHPLIPDFVLALISSILPQLFWNSEFRLSQPCSKTLAIRIPLFYLLSYCSWLFDESMRLSIFTIPSAASFAPRNILYVNR